MIHLGVRGRAKNHLRNYESEKGTRAIYGAIKKYGADTFLVEVISYFGASQESLNSIEKWYIKKLGSLRPNGYNLNEGGSNGSPSLETCKKISESHKGIKPSARSRQRMSNSAKGRSPWNKGKKTGKLSEEHREKISVGNKGKIVSLSTRQKLSESNKGANNHFFGKSLGAEHCKKISESLKGRIPWNKGKWYREAIE